MKTKWGLQIIDKKDLHTADDWIKAFEASEPIYFDTVKECFAWLGFKIPRCGSSGYGGSDAFKAYALTKYRV